MLSRVGSVTVPSSAVTGVKANVSIGEVANSVANLSRSWFDFSSSVAASCVAVRNLDPAASAVRSWKAEGAMATSAIQAPAARASTKKAIRNNPIGGSWQLGGSEAYLVARKTAPLPCIRNRALSNAMSSQPGRHPRCGP